MKKLIMITSIILGSQVFGQTSVGTRWTYMTESDCKKSDAKVVLTVTQDEIEPRIVYLRQNDKVCLIIHAEDTSVSLTIEKHPVMVTAGRNKSEMSYFKANQLGEFKIRCNGCANGRNFLGAKIVVEPQSKFDQQEEERLREESERFRKRSGYRNKNYRYDNDRYDHR